MNEAERRALLHRVGIAAWGMLTVVLLGVVVFLSIQMAEKTSYEAPVQQAALPSVPAPVIERPDALPTANVNLFFADPEGRGLVAESTALEHSNYTADNCRNAIEALIKGPQNSNLASILPSTAKIRGLYIIDNGHLVVDFGIEVELELKKVKSVYAEAMMAYGVANTVCQQELAGTKEPPVQQVSFLIEGSPPRGSFPSHIDLSMPISVDPHWIAAAREQLWADNPSAFSIPASAA